MTKRIGVLGGTFDPVHLGHLAVAEEARRQLHLSEVVFIPAGHPYFKEVSRISPGTDRIRMLELALEEKAYYRISLIEIERPGPSYAVDTVYRMKKEMDTDDEIFFIMGWDSLTTLHLWQEPERLLSLCRIVAAPRPGYSRPDIALIEDKLPGISDRSIVMDKPQINISATEIRERVRQGLPIDDMVPPAVAEYIRKRGLYGERSEENRDAGISGSQSDSRTDKPDFKR